MFNFGRKKKNTFEEYYKKDKKRSRSFWFKIATDLNSGMEPKEIAKRYKNPKTKKLYTREHIYWVIRKIKSEPIINY